MKTLNQEEMIVVAETFVGAFQHVLSNYTQTTQDLAKRFTAELVMRELPYTMVTPDGVVRIADLVFSREENRDFILMLTHVLFARLGGDDDYFEGMARTLARGVAVQPKAELCAIPDDVRTRMAEYDDVVLLLKSNTWLVTILLMQLFVSHEDVQEKK